MALTKVLLCAVAVATCQSRPDHLILAGGYSYGVPDTPVLVVHPEILPIVPAPTHQILVPLQEDHPQEEKGMPFDFAYAVEDEPSGNDFAHASNSDGKVVEGEYRVTLPDGRTQIVSYTADHLSGYVAEIKYEGEDKFPEYNPTLV